MLKCDACGVDQPANDYLYCVNCGMQLDTPTRVGPALSPTHRNSPVPWIFAGLAAVIAAIAVTWAATRPAKEIVQQLATPTPTVASTPMRGIQINTPTPPLPTSDARPLPTVETTPRPTQPPINRPNPLVVTGDAPSGPPHPSITAACGDGSFSVSIDNACGGRGGVRRWYVTGYEQGNIPRAICNDGHISYYQGSGVWVCGTGGGVRWWYRQ